MARCRVYKDAHDEVDLSWVDRILKQEEAGGDSAVDRLRGELRR